MLIREETVEDLEAIRALNRMVFGGNYEADLIDKLRSASLILASQVAVDGDELIGHILFSRLQVDVDGRAIQAASLAPMAVKPDFQRQGIGSKLMTEGLSVLRKKQVEAVIVLGHTWFYPRFGFSAGIIQHLASPFRGYISFLGLELRPGVLAGKEGCVTYPAAFELGESV